MKGPSQGDNKPLTYEVGSTSPVHRGCEVKGLLALTQNENPAQHPTLMKQTPKPGGFSGLLFR